MSEFIDMPSASVRVPPGCQKNTSGLCALDEAVCRCSYACRRGQCRICQVSTCACACHQVTDVAEELKRLRCLVDALRWRDETVQASAARHYREWVDLVTENRTLRRDIADMKASPCATCRGLGHICRACGDPVDLARLQSRFCRCNEMATPIACPACGPK